MNRYATPVPAQGVLADLFPRTVVRDIALVTGFVVLLVLSARVAVPLPFTPVPVTGQTFVVLGGAVVLGRTRAASGTAAYLIAGLAGAPLLATGGATLGYVVGFVAAATVVGAMADRGHARGPVGVIAAMTVGNIVIYAFGASYLAYYTGISLVAAVAAGVAPFIVGDAVKIAAAATLVPLAWRGIGASDAGGAR